MSKATGLAWTGMMLNSYLPVLAPGEAVVPLSGIDKAAQERLLLLADFTVELSGVYDAGPACSEPVAASCGHGEREPVTLWDDTTVAWLCTSCGEQTYNEKWIREGN